MLYSQRAYFTDYNLYASLAVLVLDIAGHCDCLMPPDGLCGCSDVLLCIYFSCCHAKELNAMWA